MIWAGSDIWAQGVKHIRREFLNLKIAVSPRTLALSRLMSQTASTAPRINHEMLLITFSLHPNIWGRKIQSRPGRECQIARPPQGVKYRDLQPSGSGSRSRSSDLRHFNRRRFRNRPRSVSRLLDRAAQNSAFFFAKGLLLHADESQSTARAPQWVTLR